MDQKRIYGKVCSNLIETKKRYNGKEEDVPPSALRNYGKYLQVSSICKELGWCESQRYVNELAKAGFEMSYEYKPGTLSFGRIVAEHTVNDNGHSDVLRLTLLVKKVAVPLNQHNSK